LKILLDTHCWLWWVSAAERLNEPVRRLLADGDNLLYLSAVSAWEIAIKTSIGKLKLPEPPATFVASRLSAQGISTLPIDHVHALHVATLPYLHRDPFDRLLVAQAQIEDLPILTADPKLVPYPVQILWAGREGKPGKPLASPAAGPRRRKRAGRGRA
jgi:PIN domain nuclease of toxin-antitoxin system